MPGPPGNGFLITRQKTETAMTFGLLARLLFPIGAFALLLGAYTVAFGESARLAPELLIGLLVLLLVVMATNVEWFVARPLRNLLRAAHDLAQNHLPGSPVDAPSG